MADAAYERPSSEADFFADYIKPPSADYESTLRLFYGWDDDAAAQIETMLDDARELYFDFGGRLDITPKFPPSVDEIAASFESGSCRRNSGFVEEIAGLTHKYLTGEGEDYEAFVQ